jgi:hypothetical protein
MYPEMSLEAFHDRQRLECQLLKRFLSQLPVLLTLQIIVCASGKERYVNK